MMLGNVEISLNNMVLRINPRTLNSDAQWPWDKKRLDTFFSLVEFKGIGTLTPQKRRKTGSNPLGNKVTTG